MHTKTRRVLFFLLTLFGALLTQLYTRNATSQLELAADNHWYFEAGQKLLSLEPSLSQLLFSPLFSLFLNLQGNLTSESTSLLSHLFFVFLPTFLFSWGIWSFLFALICVFNIPRPANLIVYTLVLLNPYLIKYASPFFSDSFSLLAGLLFTSHFATVYASCPQLSKDSKRFFESRTVYYGSIIVLCFFRYLNVVLLVSSLFADCFPFLLRSSYKAALPRFVVKVLLVCFVIIVIFVAIQVLAYFFHDGSFLFGRGSFQIVQIPQFLIMSVVLNLGFREGFRIALDKPVLLFDYQSLSDSFSAANYSLSLAEYLGSILYAFFFLMGAIIAFVGLYRYEPPYAKIFSFAFLLLVVCELLLGVSHHRYFLMFIPSVIYGLALSLGFRRV